jgi:hypothetical protein
VEAYYVQKRIRENFSEPHLFTAPQKKIFASFSHSILKASSINDVMHAEEMGEGEGGEEKYFKHFLFFHFLSKNFF